MGVGPHPVLGDAHERLVEDPVSGCGLLQNQRPVERRACRRSSQQCLRSELGYEHVGGERLVPKLLCKGKRDLDMPDGRVEPLESPEAT